MGKIKSFLFKASICFFACFFLFLVFFFILFIKLDFLGNFFSQNTVRYSPSYHDDIVVKRSYHRTFSHGSIKSISFVVYVLNSSSKAFKALTEEEKQKLMNSSYPTFDLSFVVCDKRLLNFKNVIFNGVQAKLYDPKITNLSFNTSDIEYFQFDGDAPLMQNLLGNHLVDVENTLGIKLNERLFRVLREQELLKITLISHDDVEYSIKIDNFLSEDYFNDISKMKIPLKHYK